MTTLYRPDLLYANGQFLSSAGLLVSDEGRILAVIPSDARPDIRSDTAATIIHLPGRALLPGFVNAHSHAFQRLIRGQSESRAASGTNFWSWRNTMYHAAAHLTPEDLYDVSRMAFLEMVLSGTTTVGEFHYLHNAPDGVPYDDPNLLAKQVIAAAQSVGLRIVLLRTAYLRAGFELPPDPRQARFYESLPAYLAALESLSAKFPAPRFPSDAVRIGSAPHSIRAVSLPALHEIAAAARSLRLPIHMHMAEQLAENEACLREYGRTPVALAAHAGLLGPDWTAIHATHITQEEIAALAASGATICACPTTERNLGDGILAADRLFRSGIPIALGSDSQAQIDPLEDARQLDYHLRLIHQQRAVLDGIDAQPLAARLFTCATESGARALAIPAGLFAPNTAADFFTVDLRDPSIAGHSPDDLLPLIVFSLNRTAVRDVAVSGRLILRDGRHPFAAEILGRYQHLHQKVWGSPMAAPHRQSSSKELL